MARARELFKPSTDSASLVVEIEKKFFVFGGGVSGGTPQVGVFLATLTWPSVPNHGPLLWLKIFSETRPKSAFLEPLNDFLAYL